MNKHDPRDPGDVELSVGTRRDTSVISHPQPVGVLVGSVVAYGIICSRHAKA
jgi:hypothetical protein